jgi:hypothetical protein
MMPRKPVSIAMVVVMMVVLPVMMAMSIVLPTVSAVPVMPPPVMSAVTPVVMVSMRFFVMAVLMPVVIGVAQRWRGEREHSGGGKTQ